MDSATITGIILGLLIAVCYFAPALLAYKYEKKNKKAVFVLNLFTGWTFVGWVIAFVWATMKD